MPNGIISQPPSVRKIVADASWIDMMKENSAPTRIPFHTRGTVMSRKVRRGSAGAEQRVDVLGGVRKRRALGDNLAWQPAHKLLHLCC